MKCSLRQHIEQLSIDVSSAFPSYLEFLDNVIITKLSPQRVHRLPDLPPSNTYFDFLDSLMEYLVSEKSNNVLTRGYKDSSMDNHCNSQTMNPSTNFSVNYIRDLQWNYTFDQIGIRNFLQLIVNYKGFISLDNGILIQVFGDSNQLSFKRNSDIVTRNRVVFREANSGNNNKRCLLPRDLDQLLREIFPTCKPESTSKSFRKIRKIMALVISRDELLPYNSIYSEIIGYNRPNFHQIEKNKTSPQLIVRFCLTLLYKLLPNEVWGGNSNRIIIQREIVNFIRKSSFEKVYVEELLHGIKLSDFEWLGTTRNILSKQDFELRKQRLVQFISWLFEILVKKIISTFWYVTESQGSSDTESMYFPHSVWACITSKWLSTYIRENLIKQEVSKIWSTKEVFNIGYVRPIPKKTDFRFICVPSRGNPKFIANSAERVSREKDRFEFIKYNMEILQPVQQILRLKLNQRNKSQSFFNPTCRSSSDVAQILINFRKSLLTSNGGKVPDLFLLKFDMKQCYDRLNQDAIVQEIEVYFQGENENTPYYFRKYLELDNSSFKWKRSSSMICNYACHFNWSRNSYLFDGDGSAYLDKVGTTKLLKRDIISVCKNLIFDSQVAIKNDQGHYEFYRRKRGVFQGFPLSGTFCDIIYSAMVEEKFNFLQKSESLFLRLADDFLLITVDLQDCNKLRSMINGSELHKFGAYVNIEKTLFSCTSDINSSSIKFVGLELDLSNLEIKMEYSGHRLHTSKYRSFKTLLSCLYQYYKNRLHGFLLDYLSGSLESVLWNVQKLQEMVLTKIFHDYKRVQKSDAFCNDKFISFLKDVLNYTVAKFIEVNNSIEFLDILISEYHACIFKCVGGKKEFTYLHDANLI